MNPLIAVAFGVLLPGGLCFVFLPGVIDRVLQPARTSTGVRLKLTAGIVLLAVLIAGGIWGPFNGVFIGVTGAILGLMIILGCQVARRPTGDDRRE